MFLPHKDTLSHESANRKRRERNNPSIESNEESDNSGKTKLSNKSKVDRCYKRVIRPNDSDDFEQNANETSIDSEFLEHEEESSDEDEDDFEEDDDLEKSDILPSTSKKKRKMIQK